MRFKGLKDIERLFAVGGIVSALSFTGCQTPDQNLYGGAAADVAAHYAAFQGNPAYALAFQGLSRFAYANAGVQAAQQNQVNNVPPQQNNTRFEMHTKVSDVWPVDINRNGFPEPWELMSKTEVSRTNDIYITVGNNPPIANPLNYRIVFENMNGLVLRDETSQTGITGYMLRIPANSVSPGQYQASYYAKDIKFTTLVFNITE